jgi:hypothetical protein
VFHCATTEERLVRDPLLQRLHFSLLHGPFTVNLVALRGGSTFAEYLGFGTATLVGPRILPNHDDVPSLSNTFLVGYPMAKWASEDNDKERIGPDGSMAQLDIDFSVGCHQRKAQKLQILAPTASHTSLRPNLGQRPRRADWLVPKRDWC